VKQLAKVALLLAVAAYNIQVLGQQASQTDLAAEPTMIGVANPSYPPLASQARISGDVVLRLGIRKDGTVESVDVVSGHAMLVKAAVESARQSQFTCTACTEPVTSYLVTYSYQLASSSDSPDWPCSESHQHTTLSPNMVTVAEEPHMVHPYFVSVKARSPKCLYLWRCGSRWGGEDYYFYASRSAKCLDLWNCGHQLREPFATCKQLHRDVW
jgi:TonB family protein